jgi:membrane-associated phospholipid phosphatase
MLPRVAVLAGIWAGLVGLLIAAGEIIVHSAAITGFDRHVTRDVVSSRTPALNSAMRVVTWLGSWVALGALACAILVLVLTKRLRVAVAVVIVLGWAGEALGVRIAKEVVIRDRPPQVIWVVRAQGWSFPSGHTATAAFVFTVVALSIAAVARHRVVRLLGWLLAGLAVAATAFSRVELGVHWTTDVTASIIFVSAWVAAVTLSLGATLRH